MNPKVSHAKAWLTFGVLLTKFSFGDYKEYKNG